MFDLRGNDNIQKSTDRLIAKEYVHIGQELHHGVSEDRTEEGSREVHTEDLVVGCSMLGSVQHGIWTHGQRETLHNKSTF